MPLLLFKEFDGLEQSVGGMGVNNLEGSASKIAFGNTNCVVDSLVLCREKLRKDILI